MAEINPGDLIRNLAALKTGDRTAFTWIYHCFGPKLYAYARRLVPVQEEAEEIVQEVFIKLWEHKHFIDPQQHFDGYLFRIARNLVYNKARRHVYAVAYQQYLAGQESGTKNEIQEKLDYQELNQLLEETCAALPPVRRQVFMMSRMEGRSNSEIAKMLQTSTSNIENHINKALREIRLKLKSHKIIYLLILCTLP
jgi:RNA polymerase sigma-70 factor (ECF subfamily)